MKPSRAVQIVLLSAALAPVPALASHAGREEQGAKRGLPTEEVLICQDDTHRLYMECKERIVRCYTKSSVGNWSQNFGVYCNHLPCFRKTVTVCDEPK